MSHASKSIARFLSGNLTYYMGIDTYTMFFDAFITIYALQYCTVQYCNA